MYISTDNFVLDVMDTLAGTMDIWAEQDKLSQVKNALYLNLMDKRIYKDDGPDRCLPAEYVDDTPRVIETFLRCLRLEKRTERTIEMYRGEINNLFAFVRKHYADVTTNDIRGYLSWRQTAKHNSDTTINNKIHVFQSFYGWVMSEELIEDGGCLSRQPKRNPMLKIHIVKTERKVKTVLTDEQVEIIRCDCDTLRDRAIVEVLIATGMRISELCRLDLDDLDIRHGRCVVYGKGRKERQAFFTPRAQVHLREYLRYRRELMDSDNALFVGLRRSPSTGQYKRITPDAIRRMLKTIVASDPRLDGVNLHPHKFRAYLATYMARHGAAIEDIKEVLGHSNIQTTDECYIIQDVATIQATHQLYAA